jgi:arginine decarboxylase
LPAGLFADLLQIAREHQRALDAQRLERADGQTKLSVSTYDLGLAGIEMHDILHDEYDIQIEFGDLSNFLAYISIGDKTKNIEHLIGSLYGIHRRYKKAKNPLFGYD